MKGILERLCIEALEGYYKYGTTDFIDSFEDNIVFYTPYDSRMIVGKENVIKYFTEGGKKLQLSVDNVSTRLIPLKADSMIVVADYILFAYYPDGKMIRIKQHTLVALHRKKEKDGSFIWKCPLIHISNSVAKSSAAKKQKDNLSHYEQDLIRSLLRDRNTVRKIVFSGESNSSHYIPEDSIRYVEGGKGIKCYVHTDSETITVSHLMKDVMTMLPDYYYRCHSSYIINLRRVKSIGGYKLTLESGEEIPIPAKKYALVKADITKWMAEGKI